MLLVRKCHYNSSQVPTSLIKNTFSQELNSERHFNDNLFLSLFLIVVHCFPYTMQSHLKIYFNFRLPYTVYPMYSPA